jgi:uncharacterized protein (TIGR00730 family)
MSDFAVCVFCSAATTIDDRYLALADDVGRAIAGRGWTLVSGGEVVSMMGAVAEAARGAGGRTVGVVPDSLVHRADRRCDELVIVPTMNDRKASMMDRADALLALPGGVGTCEEIFEAWSARALSTHSKPLVALNYEEHFSELLSWLDQLGSNGFISDRSRKFLAVADDVETAMEMCAERSGTIPAGFDLGGARMRLAGGDGRALGSTRSCARPALRRNGERT